MSEKFTIEWKKEAPPVKKALEEWFNFCNAAKENIYSSCGIAKPEDVDDDIRPTIIKIRQAFEDRGIDPDTVVLYPVETENTTETPLNLTMTFTYDYNGGAK